MKSAGAAGFILILFGSLPGCLAIGGGYVGNDRFQPAFVTPQRATYATYRYRAFDDLSRLTHSEKAWLVEPTNRRVISKEDLVKAWGLPDEKLVENGQERWTYRDGLRWNGVFIFPGIIIPIPLVVPIGWNTFTVDFQGDMVSSIMALVHETKGGAACTFVLVHGGVGCRFGEHFIFDFALKHSRVMNPSKLLGSSSND